MSEITVENITPERYTDDFVVDCARVSYSKRADQFTPEQNAKLIRYLHSPPDSVPHWAPFAGPRLRFNLRTPVGTLFQFLMYANQTGFTVSRNSLQDPEVSIDGSLWAWYENLQFFPDWAQEAIKGSLAEQFPVCAKVFGWKEVDGSKYKLHVIQGHSDYVNLRIKAPIFVARQLGKHQKELVWSEVSRRYINSEPELWWPQKWHKAPTHSKQGASNEEFNPDHLYWTQSAYIEATDTGPGGEIETVVNWGDSARHAVEQYSKAIEAGMAPEEARMILPQNMMTEWIWTGSRRAFERVIRERTAPGAQQSGTRETAEKIEEALQQRSNMTWNP